MRIRLLTLVLLAGAGFAQRPAADLIVTNAKVWTVDPKQPQAEAVAVVGDRLVAVGTAAEMEAWRGTQTKIIDAGGRRVLPGFNDAHVHFVDGSSSLTEVQLKNAKSIQDFALRIGEYGSRLPPGEWVTGGNWDEQSFTDPKVPTKEDIDALTRNTPVFVSRYDGHMALANSLALKTAGVTAKTKDVPGGVIVRDAKGNPTGLLKDAAMALVYDHIPPRSREQRMRLVRAGMTHAASLGVTSVQDMNSPFEDIGVYAELAEKGELTVRIYAAPLETQWRDLAKIGLRRAFGSPWLRVGALKGFADGSLGSTTAYFYEPYVDAPNTRGILSDEMQDLDAMRKRLVGADAAGLQLCIHAIGDHGIAMILDLYADMLQANGAKDRRSRIEHAQHMAAKDFDRFAHLGVIASMQPYHAIDDGRWAENRIGPERAKRTYAFRTFLDHGVRLAFGTDWFVAPLDPMQTLYAAVTRATLDGKHPDGWQPQEKIKVTEAIEAYTLGSAYAEFQEKEKGSITPGKLADLVILSDDVLSIRPETIKDVRVEQTIVGGKVVYARQ